MTADMTLAELRNCYRERFGPTLGCFIYTEFTKHGTIKKFSPRLISRSTEKFREFGFEADVQILGHPDQAARLLAEACGEYLIRQEIAARHRAGQREFVKLSDDQLDAAAKELKPLKSPMSHNSKMCGTLSEKLKMLLIEKEIAIRGTESSHQRLVAIAANADFLSHCESEIKTETAKAVAWRERKEKNAFFTFWVTRDFEHRSEIDKTVIWFRDTQGWQV